ncbi:hypothetical protein M2459_000434 [Parabacteroides sp. PF5-5]|nr:MULTISPECIES: fimbrial protein [unclassified Parabacteroides]MDH6303632.1 hypothetical protein [Parabacteroides sp. PH5-39]MDH6318291.1 hypothetical protein [Parabacteroides sp. PH5-13]MDH6321776.1 hypothetical protein [Parabacteroides sp. PH5-8]MDH6325900.1 hypothetical protein [Parabacteroides sp. PH5-41]MDH6333700.1 hypothetical protein [Parabacteroides sp. PF5-5]
MKWMMLLAIFFVSCTSETKIEEPFLSSEGEFLLNIPLTRSTDNIEDKINRARMFVFDHTGTQETLVNSYKVNRDKDENISFSEVVQIGTRDVYLIANELIAREWDDLNDIESAQSLKQQTIDVYGLPLFYDAYDDNLIPMIGIYEDLQITEKGVSQYGNPVDLTNTIKGTVERLYSKVTLNLSCVFSDLSSGKIPIRIESIKVCQMPKKIYLYPTAYAGNTTNDFLNEMISLSGGIVENPDGFEGDFEFYIPEHIVSNKQFRTYISVVASMISDPSQKTEYKIVIGDGIRDGNGEYMRSDNVSLEDLRISRNTHYTFATKITGFNGGGVEIHSRVIPWAFKELPGDLLGRKLNVAAISTKASTMSTTRIHFWSNQPTVFVEPVGYLGTTGTETFNVNEYFAGLTGDDTSNFYYDPVSGNGYIDFSPIRTEATECRIYLNAGGLKRNILGVIEPVAVIPSEWEISPYVGTFHRNDEVGERIIYGNGDGKWTAEVVKWTHDQGTNRIILGKGMGLDNTCWVKLSKKKSLDPKVGTNNAGNPESYPVLDSDAEPLVSGDGTIYFRVGLTGKLSGTNPRPRYAMIKLTYANGKKTSYLYVRQGETPDFVYYRSESLYKPDNSFLKIRDNAKKFTVYNITATAYPNADVDMGLFSGGFTKYPTQVGHLFQWPKSKAWVPRNAVSGWSSTDPGIKYSEICPPGYRIPMSGQISTSPNPYAPFVTEFLESLFQKTSTDYTVPDEENSIWGYYADGYFDRYERNDESFVGSGTKIASRGHIFFNIATLNSLFFPATGGLSMNGQYLNTGVSGNYWGSSLVDKQSVPRMAKTMRLSASGVTLEDTYVTFGYPVRCVTYNNDDL